MEVLKNLHGAEKLINTLPPEYRNWSIFSKILSFGFVRDGIADTPQNGRKDIYNAKMVLSDIEEKYKIELDIRNIGGNINITVGENMDIFDIVDMSFYGYESDDSLRIVDRGKTDLNFYCSEIFITILE